MNFELMHKQKAKIVTNDFYKCNISISAPCKNNILTFKWKPN